jgi:hypothetical protein
MREIAPMPSSLVLFALSFGVLLTFVLVLWAINYLKGWRPSHMTSTTTAPASASPVARTLPAMRADSGQGIATPGNAVNAALTGNTLPDEAREIIRFQRAVEAVVALIGSGKVGQTEAIEIIFGCKRSGRADSPYARARAAVQAQLGPIGPAYPPLTPEQALLRSQLQLDGR